jgi:hypothetical protein
MRMMNWKGCGRRLLRLRKTMINLSQDSWFAGQDSNPEPPKYEAGVLTTQLRHLVALYRRTRLSEKEKLCVCNATNKP